MSVGTHPAGLRRYGAVLGAPGVGSVVAAALLSRLTVGMAPLATLLLIRGEGRSYAVAGVVVAASSLACAIAWPLVGRLADRAGQSRVLLPLAFAYPAAFCGLALLAVEDAPVLALAACAVVTGATLPPIGACMRALWPSLLQDGEDLRDTAYALEAWLQELFFIIGPVLVAALATVGPPWAAVVAAAACCSAGTVWFALTPPVRAAERHPRADSRAGALGSKAVRTIIFASFGLGIGFGILEVSIPAFAEEHGSRAQGGFALACVAGGSLIGGIWAGTRPPARRLVLRFGFSLTFLALALLPPLAAPSLPIMCVLLLIAGMPIAPAFAASYGLVGELALPGTTTEAFAWLATAIVAGVALGTSFGGFAVEQFGLPGALAFAAPCVGAAALLTFARRASLAVPDPIP